jgi:hypothetical protein
MRRLLVLVVVTVVVGVALATGRGSAPARAENAVCDSPAGFNGGGDWNTGGEPYGHTTNSPPDLVFTAVASNPSSGEPRVITLRVTHSGWNRIKITHTVTATFPGTATYALRMPRVGARLDVQWSVDRGSATWKFCVTPAVLPPFEP